MKISAKKLIAYFAVLGVLLLALLVQTLYNRINDLGDIQEMAAKRLEELTGHEVKVGSAEIDYEKGISIRLENLTIGGEFEGKPKMSIGKAWVVIKALPLLKKQIEVKKIIIEGTSIRIIRDEKGEYSIGDLKEMATQPEETGIFNILNLSLMHNLVFQNGTINFEDRFISKTPQHFELGNINLSIQRGSLEKPFKFTLTGEMQNKKGKPTTLDIIGDFQLPKEVEQFSQIMVSGDATISDIQVSRFKVYLKKYIPELPTDMDVSLASSFSGSLGEKLSSTGKLRYFPHRKAKGASLSDPGVPHRGGIDYKISLHRNSLEVEELVMKSGPFKFKAWGRMSEWLSSDPSVSFHLETDEFQVDKSRSYLPLKIFPEKLHQEMQDHFQHGKIALKSIEFTGKLNQLHHIDEPNNFKLLSVKASLNKVDWKDPLPPLKKVVGIIETKAGNSVVHIKQAVLHGLPITNIRGKIRKLLDNPQADLSLVSKVDLRQFESTLEKIIDDPEVLEGLKDYREIDGTGLLKVHLKGPLEDQDKIRITASLDMRNARLIQKEFTFPIENFAGILRYQSSPEKPGDSSEDAWDIRLDSASGTFGKSSFRDMKWSYGTHKGEDIEKFSAVYRVDYSNLREVIYSGGDDGGLLDTIFKGWNFTGGAVEVDYNEVLYPNNPQKDRDWGSYRLQKLGLASADKYQPLKYLEGKIDYVKEEYRLKQLKGWYGNSPITVNGVCDDSDTTNSKFSLSLASSKFQPSDFKDLKNFEQFQFDGPLELSLYVDGDSQAFEFNLHAGLTQTFYNIKDKFVKPSGVVNDLDVHGTYSDIKGLTVTRLVYAFNENQITGKGEMKSFENPEFSLELNTKNFQIESVVNLLQPLSDLASGSTDFDVQVTGNFNEMNSISVTGGFDFKELVFNPEGYPYPLKISAKVNLDNNKITFDEGKLSSNITDVKFKGFYMMADSPTLDLKVYGNSLALDEIFPESKDKDKTFSEYVDQSALLSKGASRISLNLSRLQGRFLKMDTVHGKLFFAKKSFKLSELNIGTKNPILVRGVLKLEEAGNTTLRGMVKAENIKAETFTKLFGTTFQNGLTGNMKNFDVRFVSQGKTRKELSKSLSAKIKLDLNAGKLHTGRLKNGALKLFNLLDSETQETPEAAEKNFTQYQQIVGTFDLNQGILNTEDFIFEELSRRTSVVGKFDLNKSEMDAVVGVAPMSNLDKFLTKIPLVGKIITGGDEKSLLKSYYTVKGKFNDPTISMIPFTSLTKKVVGIFQGIFQVPQDIFLSEEEPTNVN